MVVVIKRIEPIAGTKVRHWFIRSKDIYPWIAETVEGNNVLYWTGLQGDW